MATARSFVALSNVRRMGKPHMVYPCVEIKNTN
jgi:hypothetical protein